MNPAAREWAFSIVGGKGRHLLSGRVRAEDRKRAINAAHEEYRAKFGTYAPVRSTLTIEEVCS